MTSVFAVDPPNAWAVVTEREVIAHGRIPLRAGGEDRWAGRWRFVLAEHPAHVYGVEGVYRRERGKDTPQSRIGKQRSSLVLARRAGIIEGLIRAQGESVEIVQSSEWRKTSGLKESIGREQLKAASVQLVKVLYGVEVSHDEADAILLGRHLAIVHAG